MSSGTTHAMEMKHLVAWDNKLLNYGKVYIVLLINTLMMHMTYDEVFYFPVDLKFKF